MFFPMVSTPTHTQTSVCIFRKIFLSLTTLWLRTEALARRRLALWLHAVVRQPEWSLVPLPTGGRQDK